MRICVVGAGVIGATMAYYLARDGHEVTIVERLDGAGLEASFANGAQLSYSYVAPLADPSVLLKLPRWLLYRDSPLRFVPRLDPQQWLWCVSFFRACQAKVSRRAAAQLLDLGLYSRTMLHDLVCDETLEFNYVRNGKIVLYRDPIEYERAQTHMKLQTNFGCEQQALDAVACVMVEPALAPLADRIAGGIYTRSDELGDCHQFTTDIARVTRDKYGAVFRYQTQVTGFQVRGRCIVAARTDQGDVAADAFVVAAGLGSQHLLTSLGMSLKLLPLNGYSLTFPVDRQRHRPPRTSVTDAHHKLVYALLGDRLRVAGFIDITGTHPTPDPMRIDSLLRQARETFPNGADYSRATPWLGRRPSTPQGKPLLGPTPYDNLWLNTGHGAFGFTLACGSARLAADCISGRKPACDVAPFTTSFRH